MNNKLKRRLAGAAVLLVATFIVVSLLPTPEQASQSGTDVVTIPLHDVQSSAPPTMVAQGAPQTLSAPEPATTAPPPDEGTDPGLQDVGSSGDDDGAGDEPASQQPKPEPRTPSADAPKVVEKTEAPAPKPASPAAPKPLETPAAPKPADKPVVVATPKPVAPATKPPERKPATAAAPPATPSSAKPAAGGAWFVQVGGFSDIGNARQVQAKLQAIGQPNILAPVDTGKGTIYRVRGGPYASEAAAQAAFAKIKAVGYPGSQLIAP